MPALLEEVSAGTILFPDEGFHCLTFNKPYTVKEDNRGLFISCTDGKHYLAGQMGELFGSCAYIGLSLSPWNDL